MDASGHSAQRSYRTGLGVFALECATIVAVLAIVLGALGLLVLWMMADGWATLDKVLS